MSYPTPDPVTEGLARYANPLGPLPAPTDVDRAAAEAWFEQYDACPRYKARNREHILRAATANFCTKRQFAEWRAAKAARSA